MITLEAPQPVLARASKSMLVSIGTTLLSLSVLATLTYTGLVGAATANVIATVAGIGPSYLGNRRWVWRRRGPSSWRSEIVPFWSMCLIALVASTLMVSWGASFIDRQTTDQLVRTAFIVAVNVATFGALWIAQFVVLDRLLFRSRAEEVG